MKNGKMIEIYSIQNMFFKKMPTKILSHCLHLLKVEHKNGRQRLQFLEFVWQLEIQGFNTQDLQGGSARLKNAPGMLESQS